MSRKFKQTIVSTVVSVATVAMLSGSTFLIPVASAQTNEQLIQQIQDQINALILQLNALKGTGTSTKCTFTRSLTVGATGDDVKCLQQYLNGAGFQVSATGAGSPGNESMYFGLKTKAAVAAWQAANEVSPTLGYFGSISRAKYDTLVSGTTPPPPVCGTTGQPACPVIPAGTGLTVSAGTQPATGLHPKNAVRVPYTNVVFTASSDGDVAVTSLTVQRNGLSTDSAFSGVVLLDEHGTQVGLAKTLNSNHQVILSEPFTIPKGTSRTMTIGANRGAGAAADDGTKASFALVAVGTSAAVNGSLPIEGTTQTLSQNLVIGNATVETGPMKTVATTTENVGTSLVFQSTRVTAGSTEDIEVTAVRWNQVGTASFNDVQDLKAYIDQSGTITSANVAASSDGKYVTTAFSPTVKVLKGNSAEVYLKGALLGGSNRTLQFDIKKQTDFAVRGLLYGFGINPTASTGFTTGTEPFYWASNITVGKATLNVEKNPAIAADNIAVNLADQPISGFTVDVKGEPISVASMIFRIAPTHTSGNTVIDASNITQIKLIGPNGIVAGPVDGAAANTVTFTDTVTFPIGKGAYKLTGKMGTGFGNNYVVTASTTPSTNWTTVTAQQSGDTITPSPSSAVTGNNMTVKSAAVTISVSATPIAQTVVSGVQQFTFANYQLDATQSGENVRFSSIPLEYNIGGNTAANLTSCQLYDGTVSKTTGSNVVNPSAAASSTVFTFDSPGLVITKGATTNLALKCNIAGGATGVYSWGYDSASSPSATGLTSGQSATITENDSSGQLMTLASGGSYTVVDNSTPGYRIVRSGDTGVILTQLKFSAQNEDIDIQKVGFQLSGTATNTPVDLVNNLLTIYDEASPTPIATAQFNANGDYATTSTITGFRVTAGSYRNMIVKGDIAAITQTGPLTYSGDFLKVDYDGNALGLSGGNYGTGVNSGTTITPSSADTSVGGVRIMKSYPVFTKYAPSSTANLANNSDYTLYQFSVQAVGGDVHLGKLTFNLASTTISGNNNGAGTHATTSVYSLYAYTDSGFNNADTNAAGNGTAAGMINGGQCYGDGNGRGVNNTIGLTGTADIEIFPTSTCLTGTTTYKIPYSAGNTTASTRWFRFAATTASVEQSTGSDSILVVLRGDAAFPTIHQNGVHSVSGEMGQSGIGGNVPSTTAGVYSDSNNDLIWSPGSTSSAPTILDFDYTNGYQVTGLPGTDMGSVTHTSP